MRKTGWKRTLALTLCAAQLALGLTGMPVFAEQPADGAYGTPPAALTADLVPQTDPTGEPDPTGTAELDPADQSELPASEPDNNGDGAEQPAADPTAQAAPDSDPAGQEPVPAATDSPFAYHEDFEQTAEGELPAAITLLEGAAAVAVGPDGGRALEIGAESGSGRVMIELPDGVPDNYLFQADVSFLRAGDGDAWAALLFGMTGELSYHRATLRLAASAEQGVQIARCGDDGAQALSAASLGFDLQPGRVTQMRVMVQGNIAMLYLDEEPAVSAMLTWGEVEGGIGFEANNAVVLVDNLTVLELDGPQVSPMAYSNIAAPKILSANLVGAPTVIGYGMPDLTALGAMVSDAVTSTVYADLELVDDALSVFSGEHELGTLVEFLDRSHGTVLTLLRIEDTATADAFAQFIEDNGSFDLHIASSDEELLRSFRARATATRATLIVEQDSITLEEAYAIVQRANAAWAGSVILQPGAADKEIIEKMQRLLMSVWVVSDDTLVGQHRAITSGATGILTTDPDGLKSAASLYGSSTLTRRPFIIGHRGTPGSAPENTMAGYRMSYLDFGSDMIETDVYLTRDGEVIILHDDYFARTTDIATTDRITDAEVAATGRTRATLRPMDLTLEQIKRLDAGSWYGAEFAGEQIPTLRELLEEIQGKDVVLFLELKDDADGIEQATVDVILSLGEEMANQVGIITFNTKSIDIMNEIYPGFSCGNLNSSLSLTPATAVRNVINSCVTRNATYNPNYLLFSQTQMQYLNARGMTAWPWTYTSSSTHRSHLGYGVSGLTTNYADWTKDSVLAVYAAGTLTLEPGQVTELAADTVTNNGQNAGLASEIVVLENDGVLAISGNTLTALDQGSAVVMLKVRTPAGTGNNAYDLYTQPITVTVGAAQPPEVESVKINTSALSSMRKNATVDLSVTVAPVEASNTPITWTSSNTNVLTVDENGRVTAHKVGSAIITATAPNGQRGMATIRVSA